MTPQLFYNTGIGHLLDEHLDHLKNMKEDTDLNLLDALSAKQGKQVWCPNQSDTEQEKEENQGVLTYVQGGWGNFSQFDKNIPSHSKDKVIQCSSAVTMTIPPT